MSTTTNTASDRETLETLRAAFLAAVRATEAARDEARAAWSTASYHALCDAADAALEAERAAARAWRSGRRAR